MREQRRVWEARRQQQEEQERAEREAARADAQQAHFQLAKQLAHNSVGVRNRTMKQVLAPGEPCARSRRPSAWQVRHWLARRADVTGTDMRKLWKGLFYCFWMSDKTPVQVRRTCSIAAPRIALQQWRAQHELADRLSKLIHHLGAARRACSVCATIAAPLGVRAALPQSPTARRCSSRSSAKP